jgi:uncharacterized Zn-binding protein involved in type VI secretion
MPAVHRDGDTRVCGAKTISKGQSTVYVNNKLASVKDDPNTHGGGQLKADVGAGTVFVNNKPLVGLGSNASPDRRRGPPHENPKATSASGDVNIG